jgi:hypothetical protein
VLGVSDVAALEDSELLPSPGESIPSAATDAHFNDDLSIGSTPLRVHHSISHPARVVEVGFVPAFKPRKFTLLFELFPISLLATERFFCSQLVIMGWNSASALKDHLMALGPSVVLMNRVITHLGLGRVLYQAAWDPLSDALVLVSGEPDFLARTARSLRGPALFLDSSHHTSKRPPPGPARRRLTHRSFGGPTYFTALFGSRGSTRM